jgi:hypothetical protein
VSGDIPQQSRFGDFRLISSEAHHPSRSTFRPLSLTEANQPQKGACRIRCMNEMQKTPSPESDISFFKRISLSGFEKLPISQAFQQKSILQVDWID